LNSIWHKSIATFKAPEKLKVSEWSDKYRVLTSESSAEAGQWKTSRAEYQRGMMDAVNDRRLERIVIMSSSQVGKTEMINNIIGYHIAHDPAPMLVVMPTLEMARSWSTQRFSKMIAASESLKHKIKDSKARDSGNTILSKSFAGGFVVMTGSNSPASLASRPCRIVLLDEVDRYETTSEGDGVSLATKRTSTFANRKIIMTSTPTIDGASRIQDAWEESDKRHFHVPCPHCKEKQKLEWQNVKWDEAKDAHMVCIHCGVVIEEKDKIWMIRNGEWIAEEETYKTAGFHLNELYSVWRSWSEVVESFLNAKEHPDQLRVFVNTSLGQVWQSDAEEIESESLLNRRENYDAQSIPEPVVLLTCGIDVQSDRIESQVVGWSAENQMYVVDYQIMFGDPNQLQVWNELDEYLKSSFKTEDGRTIKISITCIDSGYATQNVYAFCKQRQGRRIFAIKGQSQHGKPIANRPTQSGKQRVQLFPVGTDSAKDTLFSWLNIDEVRSGYIHFPADVDEEYFKQLTSERRIIKYYKGQKRMEWKQIRERNEVLDTWVYNIAGFYILNPDLESLKNKATDQKPIQKKRKLNRNRRNPNWVNSWR